LRVGKPNDATYDHGMPGWAKLAVFACLLCAGGCANDDESQEPVGGWRKASEATSGEPEPPIMPTDKRVFTPDENGSLTYRPKGIHWKTYGGRTAVGTATLSNGDLVTIRLRRQNVCAGMFVYMQSATVPKGSRRKPAFHDIMSPHVWLDTCYPGP
jgi:hypothetical protein